MIVYSGVYSTVKPAFYLLRKLQDQDPFTVFTVPGLARVAAPPAILPAILVRTAPETSPAPETAAGTAEPGGTRTAWADSTAVWPVRPAGAKPVGRPGLAALVRAAGARTDDRVRPGEPDSRTGYGRDLARIPGPYGQRASWTQRVLAAGAPAAQRCSSPGARSAARPGPGQEHRPVRARLLLYGGPVPQRCSVLGWPHLPVRRCRHWGTCPPVQRPVRHPIQTCPVRDAVRAGRRTR